MISGDHASLMSAERASGSASAQNRFWKSRSLRSRLMILGAATMVPFALFAVAAYAVVFHQQKAQVEQATLGMTRALAAAINARMQRTVATLEAFSLTQSLGATEPDNLSAAHTAARLVRESRPDWRGVLLATPDGTVLFGSESPLSTAPRQVMEKSSVAETVRTQAPVVGPMTTGPRGNIGYTVRIPIMQRGELKYVLTAIVSTDAILDVIQQQQVPGDWLVSVFDSNLKRVARSKDNGLYFGTAPSATLRELLVGLGSRKEAVGTTTTMEGDEAFTAVSRIAGTGWTIAVGAHTQTLHAAVWRTSSLYAAGLLLSLALGGFAFWITSRGITSRAKALRDSAVALGLGNPIPQPTDSLPEFDTVSWALWEAGQRLAKSEAERETLLRSEMEARTLAESAQQRLQLLLTATASISHSFDETKTLTAIASAVVPAIADIFRIDLLDPDGKLERKLTFHRDPERVAEIEEVVNSGQVSPTTPGSMPWVIASGREYVHHFDPEQIAEIEDPLFRRFVEVTGMTAVCLVPLIARDRVIGAMGALQAGSGRGFSAEDVELLCELGNRAALALDNARLYSDCSAALDKAHVAGKSKDDFLAMLGHELRNPLAPILTALEVIKRRNGEVFVRERQIIERQAQHLSHLLDDLLDISRIVAGKFQLQCERVELHAVVAHALELTQPLFEKRRAPLFKAATEGIFVRGDPIRLAQVINNLLSNAAKFSDADQLVTIELSHDADQAILSVEDQGTGIADDLLPHIFDRFVQSAQDLQRPRGGLGLGLTIARRIVELHGGTIGAGKGEDGRGTRVTVSLPLLLLEPKGPGPAPPPNHQRPVRILVVDDNKDAADMLATLLSAAGHETSTAYDAETCLDRVGSFAPDLCLLDIGLPGMDGYELARRLRADTATRALYLIALTGYGQHTDREKALDAGFDEHMTKPAKLNILEGLIAGIRSGA